MTRASEPIRSAVPEEAARTQPYQSPKVSMLERSRWFCTEEMNVVTAVNIAVESRMPMTVTMVRARFLRSVWRVMR